MKKWICLLLAATISVSSICSGQQPKSLLWEISGNGLHENSYLLGTFHMMCKNDFGIKPKVVATLSKVKKIITEIDYTDPAEIQVMSTISRAEKTLTSQLTPEEARQLDIVLQSYGTTLAEMDTMNTQSLYSLLTKKAIPCPATEVKMYEIELLRLALTSGKKTGGLEKIAYQMEALRKSYDLKEAIRQISAGDLYAELSTKMIEAFKEENIEELDRLLKDKRLMNAEQEHWMLTDRNQNWVKEMPAMMQKESILFAVGGGHLLGKQGLIELLRASGYTVKPVFQ
ncbi:TraB/GumN family protein [Nostoc ellipsosporum NOK]|nr:TraB/GumN family protein [Nostoc ellipsosporum NOK]